MNLNPFVSKIYQENWLQHFEKNATICEFDSISDIKFIKNKIPNLYINSGRNYTNAITYSINNAKDYKGKVFIIYDVPDFVDIQNNAKNEKALKTNKIRQYKGCRLNLNDYASFDDYFSTKFSRNHKKNYKQRLNRLERTHDTKYIQYFGAIDKTAYENLMVRFKELLMRRFDQLQEYNNIIRDWEFYEAIVYPLILEKKALLNTIFIDNKLVAISLKFVSKESIIGAVKTFDIDYNVHNLGNIELMKIIEWGKVNNFSYFDFSKGVQEYKKKFVSEIYLYENHIIYDSKSIAATFLATSLSLYFKLKQFLRDLKINDFYAKFLFKLKQKTT